MIRKNIKVILQNWKHFNSPFLINIVGLSIGLACTILIYLWISDELNFDKFHKNSNQLFQVMGSTQMSNDIETSWATSGILANLLQEEIPEIESSVTTCSDSETNILSVDDNSVRSTGLYVGDNFFNMFSYGLSQGDPSEIFPDVNSIILSEELALKLFNTTNNIVGKRIELDNDIQLNISGVFKEVPMNSSIQFDFVLPYKRLDLKYPGILAWGQNYFNTYLIVNNAESIPEINKKINVVYKKHSGLTNTTLFIRPYADQHLYDKYEGGAQVGGKIIYVRLFSIIAILILVIACINFINLSTASASKRMKEVGVKKLLGSLRKSLVVDFMIEAIAITLLALIISIVIVNLVLPQFNAFVEKQIYLNFDLKHILFLIGILLFSALLSGMYPAFHLSKISALNAFKGNQSNKRSKLGLRKVLVISQFVVSIVLIASVFIVLRQMNFIYGQDLGYNKDNIIYFEKSGGAGENTETFISELEKIKGVTNVTSTAWSFVGQRASTDGLSWNGMSDDDNVTFEVQQINYNFFETFGIRIKEGRFFSKKFKSDDAKIIFNEAAIKAMGMDNPIGKKISVWGRERQIVGIVKNFNYESLHTSINPLFFILKPSNCKKIMVKIEEGMAGDILPQIEKKYHEFNPGFPFEYKFLDKDYQNQYAAEQRVFSLSRLFAGVAILLSCLGLLGLTTFTTEQRRKEIGIRKVNGAKISEILIMLNKDFLKWVTIAFIIAVPIAFYAMQKWLERFAYKTSLSWWIFALAGLLVFAIALLTVSWQSWKAARRNPIEALRYE
jgi:ABC-type antimicrobial peptide transport system permease subunit